MLRAVKHIVASSQYSVKECIRSHHKYHQIPEEIHQMINKLILHRQMTTTYQLMQHVLSYLIKHNYKFIRLVLSTPFWKNPEVTWHRSSATGRRHKSTKSFILAGETSPNCLVSSQIIVSFIGHHHFYPQLYQTPRIWYGKYETADGHLLCWWVVLATK